MVDMQKSNPGLIDLLVRKGWDLLDFLSFGASVDDLYDPKSAQTYILSAEDWSPTLTYGPKAHCYPS